MKVIWEEEDIKSGLKVAISKDAEIWMITSEYDSEHKEIYFGLVSLKSGTLVENGSDDEEMVTYLNKNGMYPTCMLEGTA